MVLENRLETMWAAPELARATAAFAAATSGDDRHTPTSFSEVRYEKVASLRRRIEAGTYFVPASHVAEAIARAHGLAPAKAKGPSVC